MGMGDQKVDGKKFKKCNKSSKSKPRGKSCKKQSVVPMELQEDTMGDKLRFLNLQREIEKEQEYQDQINMIYNNPSYFDQYSNDLQYQPGFHYPLQDQFILDPQILLQNPPMYFIEAAPPHFENPLVYF